MGFGLLATYIARNASQRVGWQKYRSRFLIWGSLLALCDVEFQNFGIIPLFTPKYKMTENATPPGASDTLLPSCMESFFEGRVTKVSFAIFDQRVSSWAVWCSSCSHSGTASPRIFGQYNVLVLCFMYFYVFFMLVEWLTWWACLSCLRDLSVCDVIDWMVCYEY